jgi:large subunit ribosomal protein L46
MLKKTDNSNQGNLQRPGIVVATTMLFHWTVPTLGLTRRSYGNFTSICYGVMNLPVLRPGKSGGSQSSFEPQQQQQQLLHYRYRRWSNLTHTQQQRNLLQWHSTVSHVSQSLFPTKYTSGLFQQHTCRKFAKAAKAKADPVNVDAAKVVGYWEQKEAAKDRRRELYALRQQRKQRLKIRRAGKPENTKKIEFQAFYISKKVSDETLDRKSRQAGLEWKIKVAVLLERIPVVLPDKEKWEIEYDNLKAHMKRFGKVYPKEFTGDFDYDQERPMTEEELIAQLPFKPSPRETEADATGDVRTTDRKLKTNVFLAVQEHNDNDLWKFPTVDLKGDETLLAAAQRAVPEKLGKDIDFWCPSNCPWTVLLTPFSEEERKTLGLYGSKTFFMKVQLDEGSVSTTDMTVKDFAWLDRGEMAERAREQQGDHMSKFYHYML